MLAGLLTAIGFLSVLPVPYRPAGPGGLGRAAACFPLVGLIAGGACVGVDYAARTLWNAQVAAALLLGVSLLLTGGLHLDGLMDTADAFFSHKGPERMLAIMRDSHAGALGVASGVVLLVTKFAALAALSGPQHWRVILADPVLGRMAMAVALAGFPSARESGLGASFASETRARHGLLAVAAGAITVSALLGWCGAALVALAVLIAAVSGSYWRRRLGGLTGDIYGATSEMTELAVLLAAGAAGVR